MSEDLRHSAVLFNPQQAHAVLMSLWALIKSALIAGHRMVVEIRPETRSSAQNRKFHAVCRDFARAKVKWAGKVRDESGWKVLLVSGHTVATGGETEVVAGLEGEFVNIRESTAQMGRNRSSSLIEYSIATAVQLNVPLTEYERLASLGGDEE